MSKLVFKVALPGYRADTDTNPDHFSLYVDSTDTTSKILIKEKTRAAIAVAANTTTNISHGLGYVPFCLVFKQVGGKYTKSYGEPLDLNGAWFTIDSTNLSLINTTGASVNFNYYIFYDLIV